MGGGEDTEIERPRTELKERMSFALILSDILYFFRPS